MSDIKSYATKETWNLTIDKEVKKEMKKLVPNVSAWVEEQMRKHIKRSKNKK